MNIITFLISLLSFTAEPSTCEAEIEVVDGLQAASCGSPVCLTTKDSQPPVIGACDTDCGPWLPGVQNVCGGITCDAAGPASACQWHCRQN